MATATTTAWSSEARKAEYIASLKLQLASVQEDLYNMPAIKLGTEWHTDRCNEVGWLVKELERLSR